MQERLEASVWRLKYLTDMRKKYILDEHTFRRLLERINDYMEPDKYNLNGQFYSICTFIMILMTTGL